MRVEEGGKEEGRKGRRAGDANGSGVNLCFSGSALQGDKGGTEGGEGEG